MGGKNCFLFQYLIRNQTTFTVFLRQQRIQSDPLYLIMQLAIIPTHVIEFSILQGRKANKEKVVSPERRKLSLFFPLFSSCMATQGRKIRLLTWNIIFRKLSSTRCLSTFFYSTKKNAAAFPCKQET